MEKNNHIVLLLTLLCILFLIIMIVGLCKSKEEKVVFVPPHFDETVKQGVPSVNETEQFGWAEVYQEGIPYKTAICGNILIVDSYAFVYLTNYAENNAWLKLRVLDNEDKIVAETGLTKPGEYIEKIHFLRTIKYGEKIRLKIMAYEPNTYYSIGSVVLNTTVRTGE